MDNGGVSNEARRSLWRNMKEGYESLVMTVIRPMRALYRKEDLGPSPCMIADRPFTRQDIQLENAAGYKLECSWWQPYTPTDTTIKPQKLPCIVVLHGNSSCRLGCMDMIFYALTAGFTVFAFDFSGSGLSEGKYVSLGFHESRDIDTVTAYLRQSSKVSKIVLWGRSMGAVSALLFAERDSSIDAMVLDCPFSKLSQLATELVDDGKLNVPKIAVRLVMRMVRRSIKKRAKFDMYKLKPIAKIHKCTIPTFFGIASEDELIPPRHCEALFKKHNGPKQMMQFEGGHNTERPVNFYVSAIQFVQVMIGMSTVCPKRSVIEPVEIVNPLPEGMRVDQITSMTVRELKEAIERTGRSASGCIEKRELVDLVKKLYARYLSSSNSNSNSSPLTDAFAESMQLEHIEHSAKDKDEAGGKPQARSL